MADDGRVRPKRRIFPGKISIREDGTAEEEFGALIFVGPTFVRKQMTFGRTLRDVFPRFVLGRRPFGSNWRFFFP
jgi:hypothetical protein